MEFEESIYNLIPKEPYVPPKAARHKSKHNPGCAPTASTFGLKTTSKPGISNLGGDVAAARGSTSEKAAFATIGLPKGAAKPDASTFRLKNTGTFKLPEGKYRLPMRTAFKSPRVCQSYLKTAEFSNFRRYEYLLTNI